MQKNNENRSFPSELRLGSDKRRIEGYAALFNSESRDLGGYVEKIRKGAFSKTLKRNLKKNPILAFWNHDSSKPLGSTGNGTLTLKEDNKGLHFTCFPPKTSWAMDARESISSGLIDSCSFGFRINKDQWNETGDSRELREVDLFEVSPVSQPAYAETSVNLRKKNNRRTHKMKDRKMEAQELLTEISIFKEDGADPAKIDFAKSEYDSIARNLPGLPTFRGDGEKGVNAYWVKPATEPTLKPEVGESRSQITGGHDRAADRPFKSFGDQMRAIAMAGSPGGETDPRLHQINRAVTGLGEGTPSSGVFCFKMTFPPTF